MKRFMERTVAILASAAIAAGLLSVVPQSGAIAVSSGQQDMYRLYNPNSGEHFYTADSDEREGLVNLGWRYEGIGWVAPQSSNTPVYRLYNRNSGDHYYTMDSAEKDGLVRMGWRYEKVGWYSDDSRSVPLYQQYNPYARTGTHNYTTDKSENDGLARQGWRAEGVAWYAVQGGRENTNYQTPSSVRLFDLEPVKYNKYAIFIADWDNKLTESMRTDSNGNIYSNSEIMYANDWLMGESKAVVEYFLNENYKKFRGTLYFPIGARNYYHPQWPYLPRFEVLGDGTSLYKAPKIDDKNMGPIDFNIDISGVKILEIKMGGYDSGGSGNSGGPTLCAANLVLKK